MKFSLLALALSVVSIFMASAQQYEGCSGTANNQTLIDTEPMLISQVKNGKKYTVPYDQRFFYVIVVQGSAYQMGYAQGQLMKNEIAQMVPEFFEFAAWIIENNVSQIITRMPKFIRQWVGQTGVKLARALLSLNWQMVQKYTPSRFNDELQGIADATGMSVWIFRQINMIPEMLKASCSIYGSYSKATSTHKTIHLRSLDWESHAPMSRFPQITVYHSVEAGSVPFANIGWPAFIGSLTGYSSSKVGIGERLGDDPMSTQTRFGTPWNYVIRDALQFAWSQSEAIQILQNAQRTCSIYLGVGGENYFEICNYTAQYLKVYNWTTWPQDVWHPQLEDVLWKAYHDTNACFKSITAQNYGNITAELIYRYLAPMGQTGDSQVAVMDYANDVVYCMYANPNTYNPGYNAPPIKIDLKPFFSATILDS